MTRDEMIEQWRIAMYPHIDAPTFAAHLADTTATGWDSVRSEIDALVKIAALRSRPAPPDDLVSVRLTRKQLRRLEWAADALCEGEETCPACHAGRNSDGKHADDCWIAAALAAPAPVAAPAPEAPAEESDVLLRRFMWLNHGCAPPLLYGDDGEMQCNAEVHAPIDFKREALPDLVRMVVACLRTPETPAPIRFTIGGTGEAGSETPAPDAMPEAQVDDVIVREVTDSVRSIDGIGWAYLRDGAVWIGSGDASICRVERNGVVIWRRQEAQP